jgi:ABC-type protease/lipase transport system fused ATPase/permease subunit
VRATGLAADALRSGEAVLAMGMLPRLAGQWIEVTTANAGEAYLAERRATRLRTTLEMMFGSYRGVFLILSGYLTLAGEITTPLAISTMFVMLRIPEPFISLGDNGQEIAEGLSAWGRLKALVSGSPMPPDGLAFPCNEGRLVAERVSFAYRGPTPPLFRGLDLRVEPGEIVAIIGPSGSGKSTLLRLLIGMIRPNTGGVYLDGCSVAQWDRRDLARHVGFLPQDALLSRGTAAEVISRLEIPDMTLVLDAARRAGAHETIVGLELGYATLITGQHQLSMGQRHRIAIARALYGRPKLLVMDELAASLDAEGEAEMARLLAVLREEGTAVVFTTHRPGLLAMADRVMAIRNGTLVAAGDSGAQPLLGGRQARLPRPEPAPSDGRGGA